MFFYLFSFLYQRSYSLLHSSLQKSIRCTSIKTLFNQNQENWVGPMVSQKNGCTNTKSTLNNCYLFYKPEFHFGFYFPTNISLFRGEKTRMVKKITKKCDLSSSKYTCTLILLAVSFL